MTEKQRVYWIVAGMSSGTTAHIIGQSDYKSVDKAHQNAVLYVHELSEEQCEYIRTMQDIAELVKKAQLANKMTITAYSCPN